MGDGLPVPPDAGGSGAYDGIGTDTPAVADSGGAPGGRIIPGLTPGGDDSAMPEPEPFPYGDVIID